MNNRNHLIVFILCIVAALLIIVGGTLTLKELKDKEKIINNPDNNTFNTVTIELNGASSVESKKLKCEVEKTGCFVTLPNAIRDDGVVVGYSEKSNDLEAQYKVGSIVFINRDMTLYVISYRENNLMIDGSKVDYLEKNNVSCKMYNQSASCNVVIPKYNKVGYENKGYSTSKDSLTGFIYANDNYRISGDLILYPIYSTSSRLRPISVKKVLTYHDSFIEIENSCPEEVSKELLSYLEKINQVIPFLLIGNKISFIGDNTFNQIWGNGYVGMNYGPKSLRSVDVRCSKNVYNDYYATMVHEMSHSWDFYYATKLGSNISSQSDIINLYNKYIEKPDRPFRDYSYSNIYEFVADMMKYYYFKYYVPTPEFKNLTFPEDMKKALEKYICISKNNYNEKAICK